MTCPVCGSAVRVETSDEGTSCYIPIEGGRAGLIAVMKGLEADKVKLESQVALLKEALETYATLESECLCNVAAEALSKLAELEWKK